MIHPEALIKLFSYNAELINLQLADMSHEESLLQPPFEGNCLNWVMGHIISSRTRVLQLVNEAPVWSGAQRVRYRNGSSSITADGEGVFRLEALLADYNDSQARLVRGLNRMTYDAMCQPSGFSANSVGDSLGYFQFHEAHHVGQILMLAQMAGKKGAWLP